MLKFLGVPSTLYMFLFVLSTYHKNPDLNIWKDPYSEVGNGKNYSRFFNLSMLFSAIIKSLNYLAIVTYFPFTNNLFFISCILIGGISTILISIFPTGKYHRIHHYAGAVMFLTTIIFIIVFGYKLTQEGIKFGNLYLINSILMLSGSALLYKKFNNAAITELFFGTCLLLSDVILLFALLAN